MNWGHIPDKDLMIVPAFVPQIRVSTDGDRVIKPYGADLVRSPGIRTEHTKTSIGRVLKPFLPFPDTRIVTQSVFTLLIWLERAMQESLRAH